MLVVCLATSQLSFLQVFVFVRISIPDEYSTIFDTSVPLNTSYHNIYQYCLFDDFLRDWW